MIEYFISKYQKNWDNEFELIKKALLNEKFIKKIEKKLKKVFKLG